MSAKPVCNEFPSRRTLVPRFRFARNAKMDMKDAKVALDIIIRPSFQLWKFALGRSVLTAFKRPNKNTLLGDNASSASSTTPKKKVRFDEKPVTISRRSFFERCRKDSSSSPARPCLVIRENGNTHQSTPKPSLETDTLSVYEDCLSNHPCFLVDLHVLEGGDTRPPRRIRRRSEFYEMESGIAMFDRTGYANYCLSRWLDKKREEGTRAVTIRVFEDPSVPSWPSRTLPLPPPSTCYPLNVVPPPAPLSLPLRSLPGQIYKYIEDELQNAIVVLVIGFFIHMCLFVFLVYDILTRGIIPSDD